MNLVLNYKKKFMKNVIIIIALLLCWYACSDDNTDIPQISGITRTTFVDERDTTTYQLKILFVLNTERHEPNSKCFEPFYRLDL